MIMINNSTMKIDIINDDNEVKNKLWQKFGTITLICPRS